MITKYGLSTYYNEGDTYEIGVDEAGRGPLFGRVYVGAAILPQDDSFNHSLMRDSKKLNERTRLIAFDYIKEYGSNHTDCIMTENNKTAKIFMDKVDSAILMHNVSTQFADGGEFGMGAEIGIATGKMHARGPVGVDQLTSFKYIVSGDGCLRS